MTDPRSPLGTGGSHPEEALAAFADGTATPDERAAVLQHLQRCDRCRGEVELARVALDAMSSLPEPAAPGLDPDAIIEQAGTVTGIDPGHRPKERQRRVGPIAGGLVAAAVVALAIAGLVKLNGGNQASTASGGAASSPGVAQPNPETSPTQSLDTTFGALKQNFTPAAIDRLAADEATAARTGSPAPDHGGAQSVPDLLATAASTCAGRVAEGADVARVILAPFQGRPAFITVLREQGGGQAAIRVVVTDRTSCAVLYTTSRPIAG
jgi:hypothetical protein